MQSPQSGTVLVSARCAEILHPHLDGAPPLVVDLVSDLRALAHRLRARRVAPPAAILVEMHPAAPSPARAVVQRMRERYPDVPLVVVGSLDDMPGRELMRTVRAGAEHFAFLGQDNLGALLGQVLAAAGHRAPLDQIAALLQHTPRSVQRLFGVLLSVEAVPSSASELATALGMSRRTLDRHALNSQWPSARELLVWGRLIRGAAAVTALGESATSAERLAAITRASGLETPGAASRHYRRLARITVKQVSGHGVAALGPAFVRAFSGREAHADEAARVHAA